MPAVLVHGVPETPAVWDPLRSHLQRDDVVSLQLPGFGCARPDGFGATKEEYVAWLEGELSAMQAQGPVDLVGHDWGGGLVVRLVSTRSDLVRSWVSDAAGLGDVDFEWHEFAKIWQTPGAGEEFFDQQLAQPVEERAGVSRYGAFEHGYRVDRGAGVLAPAATLGCSHEAVPVDLPGQRPVERVVTVAVHDVLGPRVGRAKRSPQAVDADIEVVARGRVGVPRP